MLKFTLFLALAIASSASSAIISSKVTERLKSEVTIDIIVSLKLKTAPILNKIKNQSFATRGDRISTLAADLRALRAGSQQSVLDFLATEGKSVKSFWITNKIFVKDAHLSLIQTLASMEAVDGILDNNFPIETILAPSTGKEEFSKNSQKEIQWGVEMVEAPGAWDLGFTGRGVVVGTLDTGVRGTHELLRDNYRSTRGWFDTVSGSLAPNDPVGPGTHSMGSLLGKGGIGVAPDATWISCRAPFTGYDTYIECGEFLLCPTHPNGTDPDCSAAPHVLSHPWGKRMGTEEDFMDELILAWNAAGIISVFASGNEGDYCASARYPASSALPLIAVGASDERDELTDWSSRGPGAFSGAGTIRPDITAPGNYIVSASHSSDGALITRSGTPTAAPHVAGVVALLLSNGTELPYEEVTRLIFESAAHTIPPTGGNCGGIEETEYPNNAVGYGRISALGAVRRYLETLQN